MKKYLPVIIIVVVILIVGGIAAFFLLSSNKSQPESRKKITEPVNIVPVSDRPYTTLSPTSKGKHPAGTEVEITVHNPTLGATEAEYELEYQAGSLLQGAFGSIDFTIDKPPASKVILLGTCSAGGKCDYNKDVSGGTLLLRLSGGEQTFAVKGEWTYQLMSKREGRFSSRDSKFRVDVGKKGLPASTYVIVIQTMGLPAPVEGALIGGPYHITAGENKSIKTAELTLRLSEDVEAATLLGWTGSSWKQYQSTVTDKTLTATIDRLTTFVAISEAN